MNIFIQRVHAYLYILLLKQFFLAGEGVKREWNMKREFLSRRFTTNWNELPEVR